MHEPFPDKRYNIILADPPWAYSTYSDQWQLQAHNSRWVGKKYKLMAYDQINSLPISDIAAEDCVLFLWVTFPKLQEGIQTMAAWGFKYKTCGFVWIKKNKKANTPFTGMGYWTRANAELCLIGTRGSPKRISKSVHQVIYTPIRAHSQKPDEVRTKIVDLMGDLPRIELFARARAEGWDSWGDEVAG